MIPVEDTCAGSETKPGFLAALTNHLPPAQLCRYVIVGGFNTLFGYATFAGFTALLEPWGKYSYVLAGVFSNVINILFAYFNYKWFVFKTKGNHLREFFRCVAVYGSSSLIGLALLPVTVEFVRHAFHLNRSAPYLGSALLIGFSTIYNFLGHKKFSFRAPNPS